MIKTITIDLSKLEDNTWDLEVLSATATGDAPLKKEVIWLLQKTIGMVEENSYIKPYHVTDNG
jgi:hypothetical protein